MGFLLGYIAGQTVANNNGAPQQTQVVVSEKYDVIACEDWGSGQCRNEEGWRGGESRTETVYVYAGKRGYKFIHRIGVALGDRKYIVMEVSR